MPRPRRNRKVSCSGEFYRFKPAGVRSKDLEEVTLTVDEYEALRLKDKKGLEQSECSESMNISQPTFHRLITSARKKLATAIVDGQAIKIEGGAVDFQNEK